MYRKRSKFEEYLASADDDYSDLKFPAKFKRILENKENYINLIRSKVRTYSYELYVFFIFNLFILLGFGLLD